MGSIPVVEYNTRGVDGGAQISTRWWKQENPGRHMYAVADRVDEALAGRRWLNLVYASFYCNQRLSSLYQVGQRPPQEEPLGIGHRLTYNVIQSCVDTAAAKISKNKTRVLFLTSGGNFNQQQRARKLTKYVDGLFYGTDLYETGRQVFVDAEISDIGAVKIYSDDGAICAERVVPSELSVDDNEAVNGQPRSLYQRKLIHREVLAEMFPGNEEAIERALTQDAAATGRQSEMVPVREGWHLPVDKEGKDGLHVIAIEGTTLFSEKWTKSYFPFAFMRWNRRPTGFWGQGLAEQLVGIQLEITKTLKTIAASQNLMSVPRVLVEKGSEVVKSHVSNEIGHLLYYTGTQPTFMTAPAVNPEVYAHLETLYRKAFEITGISQLSANSQKPAGLDAAVALREFHDIESERFVIVGQRYEQFYLDCARIMVDLSRDLYESNKSLRVKAPGTKQIEDIAWKDVDLAEDACVMQVFPTSILPSSPQGRLQTVQEMIKQGTIGREMGMALLDFPDLEGAMSLEVAAYRDTQRIVSRILEEGEYESPEPYMNLQLARDMAQMAYINARVDGAPEKNQDLLRRFMDDCDYLLQPATPAAPAAVVAPPLGAGPDRTVTMPGGGTPALPSQLDAVGPMAVAA